MTGVFGSITKLGEGYDVQEKDIPIDIQDIGLLEWLVSRRKVPVQWKDTALKLQKQLKEAAEALPDSITYPRHRDLNYFDIEDIMNQLVTKLNESTEKNYLYQYKSERMKLWDGIKYNYEKNNIFLAEAASIVVQILKYELPAIKKSMEQSQNSIQELLKSETAYLKTAAEYQNQYLKSCKELKIKGVSIREELEALVLDLPNLFNDCVTAIQDPTFSKAIEYYKAWTNFIVERTNSSAIEINFDIVDYIIQHGNESVETRQRRLENPDFEVEESKDSAITIEESSPSTIDWSVGEIVTEPKVSAIQWDVASSITLEESSTINWDITIETEGELKYGNHQTTDIKKSKETILENADLRRIFLTNLEELNAFYTERIASHSTRSDTEIHLNELSGAPSLVRDGDNKATLTKYLKSVQKIQSSLENEQLRRLIELKNSPSYVDRLVQSVQIKLDRKASSERCASDCRARADDVESERKKTVPKQDQTIKYLKELKPKIEDKISQLYSGRKVSLYGQIEKLK